MGITLNGKVYVRKYDSYQPTCLRVNRNKNRNLFKVRLLGSWKSIKVTVSAYSTVLKEVQTSLT